jgi:WD40 repeat protein/serine/threonine protein kinase
MESLDDIFLNAWQMADKAQRAAYLDKSCGGDASTRKHVDAMLRDAERAKNLFGEESHTTPAFAERSAEGPGAVIGPYKLLEKIGEGGMGLVYMAEQREPVARKVALKIIKLGMDTREVVGRFEAERQALALMDHPNIAKVLEAGASAAGRPYFVMELVRGIKITAYCDQNNLSTRQRLDLVVQVCKAVQHAHQKGIIHRDIKPSNILVADHDGVPVPKIIDFGIAKATTDQRLTDKTVFTAFEQFIGTPVYMSPEQAKLSGLDIDTRTDIYSLGVLLYELLTGKTPFEERQLLAVGLEEMRRTIREVEPVKPSTRLRQQQKEKAESKKLKSESSGDQQAHAGGRTQKSESQPVVGDRQSAIPSDLDWIVMKCLEKDRGRRYETASGLAEDIQRFLAFEPVGARPPGAGYRFSKWVRRNKVMFAAGSAVAASLVLGLGISSWLYFKERASRRSADEAGRRLQAQLYAADMHLAKAAWDQAQVGTVLQLLRRYLPPPGEPDLRGFEWYYLERLCRSELLTLHGRSDELFNVVFSPDGKRLASSGRIARLLVWDAETGAETFAQRGASGGRQFVTFSRDGKLVASSSGGGDQPGEVTIRDAVTGAVTQSIKGLSGSMVSLAFSPDGRRIAMAGDNGVELRDVATGNVIQKLTTHEGAVLSVTFSPNGERLASAGLDKTVRVWDAANGNLLLTCRGHNHMVSEVVFSPDGHTLASASLDQTAKLWNAATGQEIRTFKGHSYHVLSVAFSPDGARLATASDDRTVKLWDASTGEELFTLRGHAGPVTSVSFSPDGKRVASAGHDGTVRIWNATGDQDSLTMQGVPSRGYGVAFHPDGKELASAHCDGTVQEWSAATGEVLHTFSRQHPTEKGDNGWVEAIAYNPDGTRLVSGCDDAPLSIRDSGSGEELLTLKGHVGKVRCAAWSPNGNLVASGGNDRTVRIWNASNGQELFTMHGTAYNVLAVAFRFDSRRLASAGGSTAKIWDTATGAELLALKGHVQGVRGIVWSPDGEKLATAGSDATIRLWEAATGMEIRALTGHSAAVMSLAFSPDGKRVASGGSGDRMIKLWDVSSGQETLSLKAHDDIITSLAFSPDGQRLASTSWDKKVKVWEAHEPTAPAVPSAEFWKDYDESKAASQGN